MKRWSSSGPIDFVLLWVDGQDEAWLKQKNKYVSDNSLNGVERYRDYGLLRCWFRMAEENAPWVNHIFLVTENKIPTWLNINNPKLTIVRHEEFMPLNTLPTFNSNAIQMYIHNINGLSEKFVLFDDDMFINKHISPNIFFSRKGSPRDTLALNIINPVDEFAHLFINNLVLINSNYKKNIFLKRNLFKLFNWRYGILNFLSLYLLIWPTFTRFYDPHLPYAYLKSQYKKVMEKYTEQQNETGHHKFREITDISHWVVRYERLVNGQFAPISYRVGKLLYLGDKIPKNKQLITIGDREMPESNFDSSIAFLHSYFDNKYEKSSFEI